MILQVGNNYSICVDCGNNKVLTYTCKITVIDNNFISFIDKFGKEYTYNINNIISVEEIKENA